MHSTRFSLTAFLVIGTVILFACGDHDQDGRIHASGHVEATEAHLAAKVGGRLLDDARSLREAGMAVRADELGAEARVAAARVRLIEAEAEVSNRLAGLRSLLDLPRDTDLELIDRGVRPPAAPPPCPLVLFWFRMPLEGSFAVLAVLTAPFMLCTLGLGLLILTLARIRFRQRLG